jgi:hypothetical protein
MSQPTCLIPQKKFTIHKSIGTQKSWRKRRVPAWEKLYALPVKIEAVTEAATEQSIRSEDIISKAAATTLSIVFTAPPGCGKTTTELAWLARVFDLYPDASVLITSQKNDSFLGLSEIPGILTVLDGIDPKPLADQIDRVFNILQQRKSLPSSRRHEYQGKPVWLLLGDWFATCNSLANNKRYSDLWNDIKTKIGLIITVGREFLVGIACDTHSFNTAALGIANDANIRDCLNIMALGKISRNEDGQEQGGYGAIAKAIGNKLVVDDDTIRSQLLKELTHMALLSDQTGRPVLFTTMGHPPRMMLLPDLRQYETYQTANRDFNKSSELPEYPERSQFTTIRLHQLDQPVINLKVSDDLAEPLRTIWLFCKEQTDWASVRDIQRKNFAV